jgi:transposase
VIASGTTVSEVFGIGPLMAAVIIGRVGDVRRFPTSGHFARHNGTAQSPQWRCSMKGSPYMW